MGLNGFSKEPVLMPADNLPGDRPVTLRWLEHEAFQEYMAAQSTNSLESKAEGPYGNICDECPRMKSLLVRKQEIVGKGLGPCETSVFDDALDKLDMAAGAIACQFLDKDLPAPEEPVPPLGYERTAYEKRCPALDKYNELQRTI